MIEPDRRLIIDDRNAWLAMTMCKKLISFSSCQKAASSLRKRAAPDPLAGVVDEYVRPATFERRVTQAADLGGVSHFGGHRLADPPAPPISSTTAAAK
jgi:hypothetical protein